MKLTVRLLGQARQYAPGGTLEVDVPAAASVHQVVPVVLAAAMSGLEALLATEDQTLRSSVLAILNGETIEPAAEGLLHENDELSLLPPMSGG